MRCGRTPASNLSTSSALVLSPHMSRWRPRIQTAPGLLTGSAGVSGTSSGSVRPSVVGLASRESISATSKPVRLTSKAMAWSSSSSRARRSSSQAAQLAERLASRRNAFTCASVSSSARATGTSIRPSLRAALSRRCPSTTVPSDLATTGMRKPNSRMAATMRSTCSSFLRGLRA